MKFRLERSVEQCYKLGVGEEVSLGLSIFSRSREPARPRLVALHIDDSKWIRIPVSVILRRHFGMRVIEASHGQEGLTLAIQERPDLIILDVMMPQMDGFDVLVKLKESAVTSKIPVIMCTSRDVTREVNMAIKFGAVAYITKPIDEAQLVEKVEEVLEESGKWGKPGDARRGVRIPPMDHRTDLIIPADPPDETLPADPRMTSETQPRKCPRCLAPLKLIEQYKAWYCYPCRKYPDHEPE